MGKQKYQEKIGELFKKSPVVSHRSIEMIIKDKKNVKQYTKQLIRNLVAKGKIKKLTKGYYTLYDDNSITVFCFRPSYLGLQDALSYHNLWEQEIIPVIITPRKVRQGIRKVMGGNILIRRIDKKYLFGFDYYKQGELYLPYSDIEKTLIDMVYFKEKMSKEVVNNLIKNIDKKKLMAYLHIYPRRIREAVLKTMKVDDISGTFGKLKRKVSGQQFKNLVRRGWDR